jgi:hypothetical protein
MRFRRATEFTVTNSTLFGHLKGGFSMESNETAQAYKDGVSKFQNNKVLALDPNLNWISKATTVITSADVKAKALADGNTESAVELVTSQFPTWSTGWTRFPGKGQ